MIGEQKASDAPGTRVHVDEMQMHPSRQALLYALDILDSSSRVVIADYMKNKHGVSLYGDTTEIKLEQVNEAMTAFFKTGGVLIMRRYDHFLEMPTELRETLIGFMSKPHS